MKSKNNRSYIQLYHDSLNILDKLSDEQAGILIKSIYKYSINQQLEKLDFALEIAISPFINQINREIERKICQAEINKENGCKGGRPKKTEHNRNNPTGYLETEHNRNNPITTTITNTITKKNTNTINKTNTIIKKINNKKNEPWEIQSIIDYFNSTFQTNKYAKGSDRQKICKYIEEMLSHGDDYTDIKLLIDYKKSNPNTKNIDLTSWLNTKYVGDNMAKAKDWYNNGCNEIKRYSDNQTQRGYEPMPDFGNTIFLDSIIEDEKADENV